MKTPTSMSRMGKDFLILVGAALLLLAAAPGYSQPASHTAKWLEDEAEATSSGVAAEVANDADKHIVPAGSDSGSILDTILEIVGFKGSPEIAAPDSGGTADRHLDRVDDRRAAEINLRAAGSGKAGVGTGGPPPAVTGDLPQPPIVAWRQQIEDDKLASQTDGPRSWVPQFWRDFWKTDLPPEESPEMHPTELDVFVIVTLAGLVVLGFLLSRGRRPGPTRGRRDSARERPLIRE